MDVNIIDITDVVILKFVITSNIVLLLIKSFMSKITKNLEINVKGSEDGLQKGKTKILSQRTSTKTT